MEYLLYFVYGFSALAAVLGLFFGLGWGATFVYNLGTSNSSIRGKAHPDAGGYIATGFMVVIVMAMITLLGMGVHAFL